MQMRSDHSFCTYLSGGLDSSYLSAVAIRAKGELDTYSIGFSDPEFDEAEHAEEVAEHLGTRHHPHRLDLEEYREAHERFVRHLGSPLGVPNQVALWVLSRELSRDHRCVLSGEGADEVFGGYGRIFLLPGDWQKLETARMGGAEAESVLGKIRERYGTTEFADYPAFFLRRYGYLSHEEAVAVLRPWFPERTLERAREAVEEEIREAFDDLQTDPFTRQLLLFQQVHLPGLLLRLDTATMAHGVEGRVPFLDHELVEFLNTLPISYRMRRKETFAGAESAGLLSDELSEVHDVPKILLKELGERILPSEIVWRRKVGFPIPPGYHDPSREDSAGAPPYVGWVRRNLELLSATDGGT
jgi:asparagine synthase (glutamine-hydrolysing)